MAFPAKTAAKKGDDKKTAKKGTDEMLEQLKKAAAEKGKK